MIDQSFSAENFRKIYEQENKKGINLDLFFSSEYMELKTKIKDLNDLTKELRKTKKIIVRIYIMNYSKIYQTKKKSKKSKKKKSKKKITYY